MGKGATGPITWLAHAKGFTSVKDYLGSLAAKNGSDEFDDEDQLDFDNDQLHKDQVDADKAMHQVNDLVGEIAGFKGADNDQFS